MVIKQFFLCVVVIVIVLTLGSSVFAKGNMGDFHSTLSDKKHCLKVVENNLVSLLGLEKETSDKNRLLFMVDVFKHSYLEREISGLSKEKKEKRAAKAVLLKPTWGKADLKKFKHHFPATMYPRNWTEAKSYSVPKILSRFPEKVVEVSKIEALSMFYAICDHDTNNGKIPTIFEVKNSLDLELKSGASKDEIDVFDVVLISKKVERLEKVGVSRAETDLLNESFRDYFIENVLSFLKGKVISLNSVPIPSGRFYISSIVDGIAGKDRDGAKDKMLAKASLASLMRAVSMTVQLNVDPKKLSYKKSRDARDFYEKTRKTFTRDFFCYLKSQTQDEKLLRRGVQTFYRVVRPAYNSCSHHQIGYCRLIRFSRLSFVNQFSKKNDFLYWKVDAEEIDGEDSDSLDHKKGAATNAFFSKLGLDKNTCSENG